MMIITFHNVILFILQLKFIELLESIWLYFSLNLQNFSSLILQIPFLSTHFSVLLGTSITELSHPTFLTSQWYSIHFIFQPFIFVFYLGWFYSVFRFINFFQQCLICHYSHPVHFSSHCHFCFLKFDLGFLYFPCLALKCTGPHLVEVLF